MTQMELSEFKTNPAKALALATGGEVVLTEDGIPKFSLYAAHPDDHLEEQLVKSPRFREEIEAAKREIADGQGIALENVEW